MVVSTTSSVAEMASRLVSVHRWCVTSTPLLNSVSGKSHPDFLFMIELRCMSASGFTVLPDLHGLLLFLRYAPFTSRALFESLLYNPYTRALLRPLLHVCDHVLWRTHKADVLLQVLHEVFLCKMGIWMNYSSLSE